MVATLSSVLDDCLDWVGGGMNRTPAEEVQQLAPLETLLHRKTGGCSGRSVCVCVCQCVFMLYLCIYIYTSLCVERGHERQTLTGGGNL